MTLHPDVELAGATGGEDTGIPVRPARTLRRHVRRSTALGWGVGSPVLLLCLWQLLSESGVLDRRFFPPPTQVVHAFASSLGDGSLLSNVGTSSVRILVGFAIGAVPGLLIGLAMGLSPLVNAIVQPLVNATFPIPKLAVLPLLILIFGLGEMSKYMVIAITVFYLVLTNTAVGVRQIDKTLFEVAGTYGASRRMVCTAVALPGAMPFILAGFRLGLNVALLVIVGAEFTGATSGIGYLIWNSWQTFQVGVMYVGLVTTALMGFAIAAVFAALERLLVGWKRP